MRLSFHFFIHSFIHSIIRCIYQQPNITIPVARRLSTIDRGSTRSGRSIDPHFFKWGQRYTF